MSEREFTSRERGGSGDLERRVGAGNGAGSPGKDSSGGRRAPRNRKIVAGRVASGDTRRVPVRTFGKCDTCGEDQPVWELTKCSMCGKITCRKCATFAYGRYFCSSRCAQYFFHGEGEDEGGTDAT
jgi:hypothetical protein